MRKHTYNILIVLSLIVALYSAYQIFKIQAEYMAGDDTYKNLNQYVQTVEETKVIIKDSEDKQEEEVHKEQIEQKEEYPVVDFTSLENINKDIMAWLYLEDSKINYPIVKGKDNDYYLTHLFDGKANSSGSIFMDYRNNIDLTDIHTIIYGHHMKNGSMFSALTKFKDQSYYEAHKKAIIVLKDKMYELQFLAGYVTNVEDNSWDLDFADDNAALNWAKNSQKKSSFKADIEPEIGDKYVTLSTCDYDFDDARYVVLGRLKEIN